MRKVFLEDLPRWEKGSNKGKINWKLSIGYKVNFIYYKTKGCLEIIEYSKKQQLKIIYLNKLFIISTPNLKQCKLGKLLGVTTSEFKIEIGTVFEDKKRNIVITDREYIDERKWYKYTCDKCGWTEGWIREDALLSQSQGCSCCSGKTVVEGINTIWDTDRWMCDLGVSEEDAKKCTSQSRDKIYPICPECRRIKDKPMTISNIYKTHSVACLCSDKISYPNKFSYSLLGQLDKIYGFDYLEHEFSPDWIGKMSYDNYFIYNGREYVLEMDGGFHFKDNKMSGQTKEESKTIDNEKDEVAKEHGIEVIRIDCKESDKEYIKQNILDSKMGDLFDLSVIDWNKCEEFALSNLVKQACDYWNSGIESTLKISEIMRLSRTTVTRYLKKGLPLGWCTYSPKEEMKKSGKKSGIGKSTSKQVEIFEDGISLGVFPSCVELSRKSEELFDTKLNNRTMSLVCNNKKPHYKGFTFRYINEIEQAI